ASPSYDGTRTTCASPRLARSKSGLRFCVSGRNLPLPVPRSRTYRLLGARLPFTYSAIDRSLGEICTPRISPTGTLGSVTRRCVAASYSRISVRASALMPTTRYVPRLEKYAKSTSQLGRSTVSRRPVPRPARRTQEDSLLPPF